MCERRKKEGEKMIVFESNENDTIEKIGAEKGEVFDIFSDKDMSIEIYDTGVAQVYMEGIEFKELIFLNITSNPEFSTYMPEEERIEKIEKKLEKILED